MRKILIISFCIFASYSFSQKNAYTIKFKVKGLKDTIAYLANYYGAKQYIQDTAKVDALGNVVFEGKEKLPGGMYIFYCPAQKGKSFDFIVADDQNITIETDTTDYMKFLKIKGSPESQYWLDYMNFIKKEEEKITPLKDQYKAVDSKSGEAKTIKDKMSLIDKEVIDYKLSFIKKYPNSLVSNIFGAMEEPIVPEAEKKASNDSLFDFKYFKQHYFDKLNFNDERLIRTPLFHKKIDFYMTKLTSQHPDSIMVAADYIVSKSRINKEVFKYVVWYFTTTYETSPIMGYDAIFVHLVEKYYDAKQAFWMDSAKLVKINDRANTLRPLLLGKKAPDLIMQDSAGKFVTLYSVQGEYTVVFFWDSDCGHCKKELPKVKELFDKYFALGVDLKVYSVCTELEKNDWKKLVKETNPSWINLLDPFGERKKYDITSTPIIYLLDKDKKIIAKKLSAEQLDELFKHEMDSKKEKTPNKK
ncbi:MAG: redoxin domain-containing protein [Bacteroidota bacterium]